MADDEIEVEPDGSDDIESDDLEALYRRALDAIETAETEVGKAFSELHEPIDEDDSAEEGETGDATGVLTTIGEFPRSDASVDVPGVSPRQVVEAALFVGGTNLTIKKLGRLLGDGFDADRVEAIIDDTNKRYETEGRPYEIVFGEGGYRLALRSDFERVRSRVYGQGPKDIRLSQDALEILALVAYRQPVTRKEVETLSRKKNAGALLNQLLRRELILLERGETKKRSDVKYRTTKRFLDIFGLREIEELPQAEELDFK